jgi:hypothetical protein
MGGISVLDSDPALFANLNNESSPEPLVALPRPA